MKAIQKRKQVKPAMEFATDINIILECLYEVYGQEAHHVLKGRDIQKTMVFPFLKMLVNQCDGISVREMHKKLWEIYIAEQTKETFISNAESLLESLKCDEENGDHIVCCE